MPEPLLRCLPVGPLETNCYIVGSRGSGLGIIVDPGAEPERIWQAFSATGLAPAAIVLTHTHFDHAGGVAGLRRFCDAPVAVHAVDAPALAYICAQAAAFGLRVEAAPEPDRLLADGDTIDLGDFTLEVRHTPGHTPGGIVLVGPGILLAGDTLFAGSVGRTDLPGGDWGDLQRSIAGRILDLPDDTLVLPGHGPATRVGDERRTNPFLG